MDRRWSRPFFPLAIRVEMAPLDPNAGALTIAHLTMPVRVIAIHGAV